MISAEKAKRTHNPLRETMRYPTGVRQTAKKFSYPNGIMKKTSTLPNTILTAVTQKFGGNVRTAVTNGMPLSNLALQQAMVAQSAGKSATKNHQDNKTGGIMLPVLF